MSAELVDMAKKYPERGLADFVIWYCNLFGITQEIIDLKAKYMSGEMGEFLYAIELGGDGRVCDGSRSGG